MADLKLFKELLMKGGFNGWYFPDPQPPDHEPEEPPPEKRKKVALKVRAGTKRRRQEQSPQVKLPSILRRKSTEQLEHWVRGQSYHSRAADGAVHCCPDFSCCYPDLLAPLEVRRKYQAAWIANDRRTLHSLDAFFYTAVGAKLAPQLPVHFQEFRCC